MIHISEIRELPIEQQEAFFRSLTPEELLQYQYNWEMHARPKQLLPEDGWFEALIMAGRGAGKAHDIMSQLPTPSGYKLLRDIVVGDKVFDENGKTCNVTAVFEVPNPEKSYRLHFSDGTSIDCCSEHQWITWTHRDRKSYERSNDYNSKPKLTELPHDWPNWSRERKHHRDADLNIGPSVKTTQQIIDTFRHGKRGDLNHSIPVCKPVEYPHQDLEINPYILGYWLGGGGSNSSYIKESIPDKYIFSSIEQRTALLQGLMDSDGFYHSKNGYVEFSQCRKWISELVYELAASLGQNPTIKRNKSQLNGEYKQDHYRVTWRIAQGLIPFRLQRKIDLIKPAGNQNMRNLHRMITDYEEIKPVPMRCLTVDSPNSLFLVGKNYLVTHNTRTGSEWIRQCVEKYGCRRIGLVGPTAADVREVMWDGDSGIRGISPPWNEPLYQVNRGRLVWPNGAVATFFSAEEPENLRGPQHDAVWFDEPARCKKAEDVYDQIMFGLRLQSSTGVKPRILMTTTPRNIPLIRSLYDKSQDEDSGVLLITGSTKENAQNLDDRYLSKMEEKYAGTRLGRQEVDGELLGDHENPLWTGEMLEDCHKGVSDFINAEEFCRDELVRVVVGVDPSGSSGKSGDMQGIVVAGVDEHGHYWIIDDCSVNESPEGWAKKVRDVCKRYSADKIIAEKNFGGHMVKSVVQTVWPDAPIKIIHASSAKQARAEPISMLYEQGRVSHLQVFKELEEQMFDMTMNGYKGSGSPDRVDALVWAMKELKDAGSMGFGFSVKGII